MYTDLKSIEYRIMIFVWNNEKEGVSFGEIHDYANSLGKVLTRQRVYAFIQSLTEKGFLKAEGGERRKIYYPLVLKQDYDNAVANDVLNQLFEGSLKKFVNALTGGHSLSDKEAKELKAILKKRG